MSRKMRDYCEDCGMFAVLNDDGICGDCEWEAEDEDTDEEEDEE